MSNVNVVANTRLWGFYTNSPKRITNNQKRYILLVCISQNIITLSFNHVSICED